MSTWSAFFDYVLPHVPGCPQAVATQEIRNAAIDFCSRTRLYRHDETFTVLANEAKYPLTPVTDTVVSEVLRVWFNSREIYPKNEDELASINNDWKNWVATQAYYYFRADERTLQLVPKPNTGYTSGMVIIATLKPTRASLVIDTRLFEEYVEEIAYGARYRLMLYPSVPYSNPPLAKVNKDLFEEAINRGLRKAMAGLSRATSNFVGPMRFR